MERANRMICGYCSQEQVYTSSTMHALRILCMGGRGGGEQLRSTELLTELLYSKFLSFFLGVHYQQSMYSMWLWFGCS